MPRVSTLFAVLIPVVAIFLVCRTFDVSARLQLSWPLASHPDNPSEASQIIIEVPVDHPHIVQSVEEDAVEEATEHFTRTIVAVGDLHGDLPNAHKVLHMAGVVDEEGRWSGNVDFFVQTGDIIDR